MPDKYTYAQMAEARRKQVAEKYGTSGKVSSNPKQPIPQQMPSRTDMRPRNNWNNRIFNWPDMEVSWGQTASGEDSGMEGDWASKALAIGNGITSVMGSSLGMSQIADTSRQRGWIKDISTIGQSNYGNYGQILSDYNRLSLQPDLNYEEIRGGSTGERIGDMASAALAGASAGSVFGPYGVAIGGLLGGTAAGIGWVAGDDTAKYEYRSLLADAREENYDAGKRVNAGVEDYTDSDYRNRIGWVSRDGGPITRKTESVKDFANRVLEKGKSNDVTRSSGITRERVKGGVKIKIKR